MKRPSSDCLEKANTFIMTVVLYEICSLRHVSPYLVMILRPKCDGQIVVKKYKTNDVFHDLPLICCVLQCFREKSKPRLVLSMFPIKAFNLMLTFKGSMLT